MRFKFLLFMTAGYMLLVSRVGAEQVACQADLSSKSGGRLEVSRVDYSDSYPFVVPVRIDWHPPAVGHSTNLVLEYNESDFDNKLIFSGAYIKFNYENENDLGKYEAVAVLSDRSKLTFNKAVKEMITGGGVIVFPESSAEGRSVLSAIKRHQHIKITLLKDGFIQWTDNFDTGSILGRNRLLSKATHLIEKKSPEVCKTEANVVTTLPPGE